MSYESDSRDKSSNAKNARNCSNAKILPRASLRTNLWTNLRTEQKTNQKIANIKERKERVRPCGVPSYT